MWPNFKVIVTSMICFYDNQRNTPTYTATFHQMSNENYIAEPIAVLWISQFKHACIIGYAVTSRYSSSL